MFKNDELEVLCNNKTEARIIARQTLEYLKKECISIKKVKVEKIEDVNLYKVYVFYKETK